MAFSKEGRKNVLYINCESNNHMLCLLGVAS